MRQQHKYCFINEDGIVEEAKLTLRLEQRNKRIAKETELYRLYKMKNLIDKQYKHIGEQLCLYKHVKANQTTRDLTSILLNGKVGN